jgi:hypothetical protein
VVGIATENLGTFYDHLVYFIAIGNILWPFDILCGHLVYFSPFWYFVPRKIWQHWAGSQRQQTDNFDGRLFVHKKTINSFHKDKLAGPSLNWPSKKCILSKKKKRI